eukprot:gene6792-7896_t
MERLDLVLQTSPFEEKVTRNGLQKNIRVVIKNSPFTIQLKLRKHDIDLNHVAFEATLLYDNDQVPTEEKEVDYVKSKPVEHKATPNEIGDMVTVELRIKVLTSQHEDMFFKVKIEGFDPISKAPIKNLYALTSPIKVISKPEQLKKKQPPKKRSWNDILMDSVAKIQIQQSEQQRLIEKLIDHNFKHSIVAQQILQSAAPNTTTTTTTSSNSSSASSSAANSTSTSPLSIGFALNGALTSASNGGSGQNSNQNSLSSLNGGSSSNQQQQQHHKMEFEDAFKQMMSAYVQLDPRQRAEKVRRVFRNASSRDSETLSELLDLFITEGVGGPLWPAPLPISSPPNSSHNGNNSNNNNNHNNNNNNNSSNGNNANIISTSSNPNTNNPFLNAHNSFVERTNNNDPYPFFPTMPTSFDNEFGSVFTQSSGTDFIPF